MTDLTFAQALDAMKCGKSVTRRGWDKKDITTITLIMPPVFVGRYFDHIYEHRLKAEDILAGDWYVVEGAAE